MKSILEKCEKHDFVYISEVLDSYFSFTNDVQRKKLLAKSEECTDSKAQMIELIDKQIRYYGSSDIAYIKRSLLDNDGGISSNEVVADVCKKLKVNVKMVGSLESRLERLVDSVVEKELVGKSPEELAKIFKDIGVGNVNAEQIFEYIKKKGDVAILPVIRKILGSETSLAITELIVVKLIAQIIGKEAAKVLIKKVLEKYPWITGPAIWVLSGVWLTIDLQGVAYRKTVPICLYLGVVGLRDGAEDDKLS